MIEDLGALNVRFTPDELTEFRSDFGQIELVGVHSFESWLEDQ